jgi:hypothetical protein
VNEFRSNMNSIVYLALFEKSGVLQAMSVITRCSITLLDQLRDSQQEAKVAAQKYAEGMSMEYSSRQAIAQEIMYITDKQANLLIALSEAIHELRKHWLNQVSKSKGQTEVVRKHMAEVQSQLEGVKIKHQQDKVDLEAKLNQSSFAKNSLSQKTEDLCKELQDATQNVKFLILEKDELLKQNLDLKLAHDEERRASRCASDETGRKVDALLVENKIIRAELNNARVSLARSEADLRYSAQLTLEALSKKCTTDNSPSNANKPVPLATRNEKSCTSRMRKVDGIRPACGRDSRTEDAVLENAIIAQQPTGSCLEECAATRVISPLQHDTEWKKFKGEANSTRKLSPNLDIFSDAYKSECGQKEDAALKQNAFCSEKVPSRQHPDTERFKSTATFDEKTTPTMIAQSTPKCTIRSTYKNSTSAGLASRPELINRKPMRRSGRNQNSCRTNKDAVRVPESRGAKRCRRTDGHSVRPLSPVVADDDDDWVVEDAILCPKRSLSR